MYIQYANNIYLLNTTYISNILKKYYFYTENTLFDSMFHTAVRTMIVSRLVSCDSKQLPKRFGLNHKILEKESRPNTMG